MTFLQSGGQSRGKATKGRKGQSFSYGCPAPSADFVKATRIIQWTDAFKEMIHGTTRQPSEEHLRYPPPAALDCTKPLWNLRSPLIALRFAFLPHTDLTSSTDKNGSITFQPLPRKLLIQHVKSHTTHKSYLQFSGYKYMLYCIQIL